MEVRSASLGAPGPVRGRTAGDRSMFLVGLMRRGDRHFAPDGPPVCDTCGHEVGASEAHPLMTRAPA